MTVAGKSRNVIENVVVTSRERGKALMPFGPGCRMCSIAECGGRTPVNCAPIEQTGFWSQYVVLRGWDQHVKGFVVLGSYDPPHSDTSKTSFEIHRCYKKAM